MINKALNEQKKEIKRVEEDYQQNLFTHKYNGWDVGDLEPKMEEYNGITYEIIPAWVTVIDDYDEALGSVELSHRHSIGFSYIRSYEGDPQKVDFRFIRAQDRVKLTLKDMTEEAFFNSTNLRYSNINGNKPIKFDITIDSDIEDLLVSLRIFLKNNKEIVKSINFQGANSRFLIRLIERMCLRMDMYNISFFDEEEMEDTKEKPTQYKK